MTKRKIGPPRARPKPPPRPEIRLVEEQFSRVALGPEDVIVVRLAVPVQPKELVILRGIVEGKFPGRKVLVLAEGVEIGAMGPGTLDVDERIADAAREWRRAKKEH